ncbi:ABC transporter substrate-binding protein [Mesorhizobium sp. DCY119]|uniref:ABC transporter substrate-binding protein n=1 Tax=Mesorhizobium sp. DCY119 TaxID=2108445 RepID=UPI000E731A3E|nr:ABC transporter substrate-binding protein [Mesorhizobium sp. DCY119]RJG40455.1 ABC transporter substrate-binding protein [Mesorhizobium sp. DCY119]
MSFKVFGLAVAAAISSSIAFAADTPKAGGTLNVALQRQADCIDPQQSNYGYGSVDGRQLVDSLTDQSYAEPTKIVPWLAKSWEISDDAKTFTFHLRDDVTFSDGSPLDSAVVKRNFEVLTTFPGAAGGAYLKGITSIKTPDAHTVRIAFNAPNVPFLQATSTAELGIVSQSTLDKTADRRCAEGVVGAGPFVIEKVIFNEQATFAKRVGYNWASELRGHQGEAYLDKVVYRIVSEGTARSGALQAGQVDVIQNVTFDDVPVLEQAGYTINRTPFLGLSTHLVINTKSPILKDKEVRRALQRAINRQDVVDLAYSGYFTPAKGTLTPESPNFLDQSEKLSYDPDEANRIFDAAGWTAGSDGVREKDGQKLKITASFYAGPANQAFLEVIQQQLRDVGVDFQLRPLVGGAFDEALLAGDYDLHRWAWSLAEPDVIRAVFSTHTLNRFQLDAKNPLDGLLDAQRATTDPEERAKLTADAQRTIVDEAFGLPIFNSVGLWASNAKVKGETFGAGGAGGPNQILYDTWINQ